MRNNRLQITDYRLQKKVIILFSVLCSLYSVFLIGCAKREIKNIDSKGKNIVCFGDSITFGYGVNPGEDYPSALASLINVPVVNAGKDGDTSVDALKRIEADVLDKEPRLVIIEFSGNDFLEKVPKETTFNNIRAMIKQVQAKGAMAAIVDISSGMFLREYRASLRKIAYQENAVFIPGILSGIITNPGMKSDFFHPNADGYKIIAQRIHQAIKPYLKQ